MQIETTCFMSILIVKGLKTLIQSRTLLGRHAIVVCQQGSMRRLLDEFDFPAARSAWKHQFAGR